VTDLSRAAAAAVDCLGIGPNDSVLVVRSERQRSIADAFIAAARGCAREVTAVDLPPLSRHGEEPPAEIAEQMARADVVFAPTSTSLSVTQARVEASKRGARIASLPTITEEIFVRAVPVDYAELKHRGEWLADRLTAAASARISSDAGTDIVLDLEGRSGRCDDGDLRQRGAIGNLPAGEAFISPLETFGDGVIVIDGSLAGHGVLTEPVRVTVAGGRAVDADGEVGDWLLRTLDAGGELGRSLAELGIGTNPAAILSGNVLEDEKVIGTAHLAFGTSAGLGGVNVAGVHIDGVLRRPTVELDGVRVVDGGRLLNS
jgi:leucyl aminopeptidase (aminopeptidase T)